MRLQDKALVELKDIIRKDPEWRAAAWRELRFRVQSKRAFMDVNWSDSDQPRPEPASVAILWKPPAIEPEREGPMV